MQVSAEVSLEKPASEYEDATDLTIHMNSKMKQSTLVRDSNRTLLSRYRIKCCRVCHTSHGSGSMLKYVNGLHVKPVAYVPIRDSSYPALPNELQSMNYLLNKRNREDNNCFL